MKKIFLLLFVTQIGFSQSFLHSNNFAFDFDFEIKAFKPVHFGNNFLAKSNEPDTGIGLGFNLLKYKHFSSGIGIDYTYYSITDITRAGNIRSSRLGSFYGKLSYNIELNKDFLIVPSIGFGASSIDFQSKARTFGSQKGNETRFGVGLNYKLSNSILAILGFNYVYTKYYINTSEEFISFYDNSKILQIILGLKFY